jgi:hypothetical protein
VRTAWLLVLVACGGSHKDPTPPSPPPDAEPALTFDEDTARRFADGFLEVLGAMAEAVEARVASCVIPTSGCPAEQADDCPCQVDCEEMAGDLDAIFDVSAPLFELAVAVQADDEAARLAVTAMRAHADAAEALEARISNGLLWCRGSAAVLEVIERMPTL